jgi:hypothetical protein
MPAVTLTDLARLRVETISFFLGVFLLSALAIKLLWNWLANDFASLPRLTYGKAVGLTGLWGLLFVIVLTMISGARELMTPGAWVKNGATYKLRNEAVTSTSAATGDQADLLKMRRERLSQLGAALQAFAREHEGHFPTSSQVDQIATELWSAFGSSEIRYVYWQGLSLDGPSQPLASEPNVYAGEQLVLFTDGEIKSLAIDDLLRLSSAELPR